MTLNDDIVLATSDQIAQGLGERIEALRLSRNMTQQRLALDAGVSLSTLKRLEHGQPTTLDTFVRVLIALRVQDHLANLLPDPGLRPVERVRHKGRERRRARPAATSTEPAPWSWAEEDEA